MKTRQRRGPAAGQRCAAPSCWDPARPPAGGAWTSRARQRLQRYNRTHPTARLRPPATRLQKVLEALEEGQRLQQARPVGGPGPAARQDLAAHLVAWVGGRRRGRWWGRRGARGLHESLLRARPAEPACGTSACVRAFPCGPAATPPTPPLQPAGQPAAQPSHCTARAPLLNSSPITASVHSETL